MSKLILLKILYLVLTIIYKLESKHFKILEIYLPDISLLELYLCFVDRFFARCSELFFEVLVNIHIFIYLCAFIQTILFY